MTTTIETYGGAFLDFADPQPDQIDVEDIAHALSQTCRFGGHTSGFYSVAEHALMVRALVVKMGFPELALAALHHDSHEAYLGDVPTPLKHVIGDAFIDLAPPIDAAIGAAFGIDPSDFRSDPVKQADRLALRIEAKHLKPSRGVGERWGYTNPPNASMPVLCYEPWEAKEFFLAAHNLR